jgi:hypothetical protein
MAMLRSSLGMRLGVIRALCAKRTLHVLTFNFDEYRYSKPQTDLTSPPSIRSVEPVIQRAPGDTKKAISSAISSGSP